MTDTTKAVTKAMTDVRDAVQRIDDASTALAQAYGDLSAALTDIQRDTYRHRGKKTSEDLAPFLASKRVASEVASVLRALGLHEVVRDGPDSEIDLTSLWEKRLEFVRLRTMESDTSRRSLDPARRHLIPGQTLPNTARRGLPTQRGAHGEGT